MSGPPLPAESSRKFWLLLAASRYGEAEDLARQLSNDHPGSPFGFDGIAIVHQRRQHMDEALAAWDDAIGRFPGRPHAILRRGLVLDRLGRHAELVQMVEEFIGRRSPDYQALLRAGWAGIRPVVPPSLLTLYCQARLHLRADSGIAPLYDDLVSFQHEADCLDGLFGDLAPAVPWFGNRILHPRFRDEA